MFVTPFFEGICHFWLESNGHRRKGFEFTPCARSKDCNWVAGLVISYVSPSNPCGMAWTPSVLCDEKPNQPKIWVLFSGLQNPLMSKQSGDELK